ncbi:TPA: hypothetical protein DCX16_01045 [bacterium]|nr:hypothetical protein [bacterium]
MKVLRFIIFFIWLVVMLALLKKEGILFFSQPISYYDILGKKDPYREEYLGLYMNDKKIGFSKSYIDAWTLEDDRVGFRISNETRAFVSSLDIPLSVNIVGDIYIDDKYKLDSFEWKISSGMYSIEAKGERKEEKIEVCIYSGGNLIKKESFDAYDFIPGGEIFPLFSLPSIKEGARYTIGSWDPFGILGKERIVLKVHKATTVTHNEELFDVYPIEVTYQSIKANIYATKEGKILKAELPYGWVAIAEDKRKEREFKPEFPDISIIASIPSNVTIEEPRKIEYIKAKLNDDIVEIKKEIIPKNGKNFPIKEETEWLEENLFVQSNSKEIKEKACAIVGEEKDSLKVSILIMEWIYKNIRKKPSFSIPSALEVLKNMSGDCNEHSVLFTALTRSLGIPTKMVAGIAYQDGKFYYHNWCKVFIGEWVSIDPTFNQLPPDATHIPLIEGDIDKQIGLLGYVGDVKLEVFEYH